MKQQNEISKMANEIEIKTHSKMENVRNII